MNRTTEIIVGFGINVITSPLVLAQIPERILKPFWDFGFNLGAKIALEHELRNTEE